MTVKRIVLIAENGGESGLLNATLRMYDEFTEAEFERECYSMLTVEGGESFSTGMQSVATYRLEVKDRFSLVATVDGERLFVYSYGQGYRAESIKNYVGRACDVKKAYDDEAISTDNYYLKGGEIKGSSPPIMFEKGHIYKNDANNTNQNSTVYPQLHKGGEKEGNDNKPHDYTQAFTCQTGGDRETEAEKNKGGGGEDTVCNSHLKKQITHKQAAFEWECHHYPHHACVEAVLPGCEVFRVDVGERFYLIGAQYDGELITRYLCGAPLSTGAGDRFLKLSQKIRGTDGRDYVVAFVGEDTSASSTPGV